MGWDSEILPVPEIPYESDLYNDGEDALVALFDADGYLQPHYISRTRAQIVAGTARTARTTYGDGKIEIVEARQIVEGDFDTAFAGTNKDNIPAIYVCAIAKDQDAEDHAGIWGVPMHFLVAVIQGASDLNVLRINTKRRLGEIERACRQKAGGQGGNDFWVDAYMTVGASRIDIRGTDCNAVGWLAITIVKGVENRQEAI